MAAVSRTLRAGTVLAAALAAVALLDAATPSLDARGRGWDSAYYLDMAERGVRGHHELVAPFAYRPVGPLLTRALALWLPVSVDDAFRAITWAGVAIQLGLAFALARLVAPAPLSAVVAAVAALSLFNARFLLLDVYRPDALGLPLTLAATWAILANRPALGALLAGPGLIVREFLLAPLAAALDALVRRPPPAGVPHAARRGPRLAAGVLALALAAAAGALPRLLIPVARDVAATSPLRGDLLATLLGTPLALRRDLSLVFCVASYALPLLALGGGGRLRGAWTSLGERRRPLVVSVVVTLLLALYGGTDLPRFAAYLAAAQSVVLAAMLARDVSRTEIVLMLVAVAVFNRLHVTVLPVDVEAMLDFYAGYADRVNAATAWRAVELIAWVAAVRLARRVTGSPGGAPGLGEARGAPGAAGDQPSA